MISPHFKKWERHFPPVPSLNSVHAYGYVTLQLNLLCGQGQTVQGTGALLGLQIEIPPDFHAKAGSEIEHPSH